MTSQEKFDAFTALVNSVTYAEHGEALKADADMIFKQAFERSLPVENFRTLVDAASADFLSPLEMLATLKIPQPFILATHMTFAGVFVYGFLCGLNQKANGSAEVAELKKLYDLQ